MNHNPLTTETLVVRAVKVTPLSGVLKLIGHPNLHETDAFTEITFGDATMTLCSGWRLFGMIDRHLSGMIDRHLSDDANITYTDEQSTRLYDFFEALGNQNLLVDMES